VSSVRFRELRVQLEPGVVVIVDVSSTQEIAEALTELRDLELLKGAPFPDPPTKDNKDAAPGLGTRSGDPGSLVETRAGLSAGSLDAKNLLAFKDGVPQLLRPNLFSSVSDAALALLFAVEIGLGKAGVSFDNFKPLYDGQNIKSGTALSMLLTNLRNGGYLDKKAYAADRTIRLTAKGEKKAIEVLNELAKQ
jgi:hypothetical protein